MTPPIGMLVHAHILGPEDRPMGLLRAAVRKVREDGLRLLVGRDYPVGVEWSGLSRRWLVSGKRHPHGVNLLGAVLLAMQPDRGDEEDGDAELAAADALGVTWTTLQGAIDGLEFESNHGLLIGAATRDPYRMGLQMGARLWSEITVECPVCGDFRRSDSDDVCACTVWPPRK